MNHVHIAQKRALLGGKADRIQLIDHIADMIVHCREVIDQLPEVITHDGRWIAVDAA